MAEFQIFDAPPISQSRILRYAGAKEKSDELLRLLDGCIKEAAPYLRYGVCSAQLPVRTTEKRVFVGDLVILSQDLVRFFEGKKTCVLFCASIGPSIDRLIYCYGRLSPARALLLQAFGAERVEALCDAFCEKLSERYCIQKPRRFSPGYGDLPLSLQKEILPVLEAEKYLGVSLGEGLLMSPSKTVTAFAAV